MRSDTQSYKMAALEFRERLRKAEVRFDTVWNKAIEDCMFRFGMTHNPPHRGDRCFLCWIHGRLRDAFKLEIAGYVPIKERMIDSLDRLIRDCKLEGTERRKYFRGIVDAKRALFEHIQDWE